MKFTFSWLKEFLETEKTIEEITNRMNEIGLEVEEVIDKSKELQDFNCVLIEECENHPDSDHLHICKVRYNKDKDPLNIVCGAPNARKGLKTILAPVGSKLPNGLELKKTKIRGIESNGMLCSIRELGLGEEHEGIMEISNDVEIGTNIADILNIKDQIIDISITPNRGDCLSVYGIARDLACAGMGKLKHYKEYNVNIDEKENNKVKLTVEDVNCPVFYIREINNLKNCESPKWLQERLKAIDMNPKNALVDITNYVMMCFGRPLHCYDVDKIEGNMIVAPAENGEEFIDLFDKKHALSNGMTLIKDDKKNLCLGGVIGAKESCSELETKNVVLEVAVFDAINTARTGRLLNVQTDSRYRFERGVDYEITEFVLNYATKLIQEICGGEASKINKYENENYKQSITRTFELDINYIYKLLGIEIDKKDILSILKNFDYIVKENGNILTITAPYYKNNILVKEDVIDDIIRIYGYNNLKDRDFVNTDVFEKDGNLFVKNLENKLHQARQVIVKNGFVELISYAFLNKKDDAHFSDVNDELDLMNPIIADLSHMRQNMIPNILNIIKKNINRGFGDLSFFEIGRTFNKCQIDCENDILACVRYGKKETKSIYNNKPQSFDVFDIKKDLFDVLEVFGINGEKLNIDRNVPKYYHPNRSGALYIGKMLIGYFGELHPNINTAFELKDRIFVCELMINNLPKKIILEDKVRTAFKPNDLQAIDRDFAFILNNDIAVGDIIKNIYNINKELITDINLFDIYTDEKMQGKKSVAFSVKIQPKFDNLNKEEIDKISADIIDFVNKNYGGILRDGTEK